MIVTHAAHYPEGHFYPQVGRWDKQEMSCRNNENECSMFTSGQFHEEGDKVKIKKYVFFHCKLIALTQTVLHVLGKNVFILFANLFS